MNCTPAEIRQFRLLAGWTQKKLAWELGMRSPKALRTIQNWERGENLAPPYLRLALMALNAGFQWDRM